MSQRETSSELSNRLIELFTSPHQELISRSRIESTKLALGEALSKSRHKSGAKLWRIATERLEELSHASTLRVTLEVIRTAKSTRVATQRVLHRAWTRGVCYRLIDYPEITGYSILIAKLSYLPSADLESLIPRLIARGLFTSILRGLDAQSWTADCYDLALTANARGLTVINEQISANVRETQLEIVPLIRSARWLKALIDPHSPTDHQQHVSSAPPSSLLTLELLTCNWLRGVRRSGSRLHGKEMSQRIQKTRGVIIPRCLHTVTPSDGGDDKLAQRVNLALAPLRLEWLSACAHGLLRDPSSDQRVISRRASDALREVLGEDRWRELKRSIATTLPNERSELHAWLESVMPERKN